MAPTFIARAIGRQEIDERVKWMWHVHQNRQEKKLGPTNKSWNSQYGIDESFDLHHGMTFQVNQITEGVLPRQFIDNQFIRWNEVIDEYPEHHDDIDDCTLYETDNPERFKQFKPLEKHVDGVTEQIAPIDDETIPVWSDGFGENPISQPPTSQAPTVDHGMDEDYVWAFRNTHFGQHQVQNWYAESLEKAASMSHAPFWGLKLAAPAFYRDDKFKKFQQQWAQRLGLEQIKMKHALDATRSTKAQRKAWKQEIQQYIEDVYHSQISEKMRDVYVTDHKPRPNKYLTFNAEEDAMFFKYRESLNNYKTSKKEKVVIPAYSKFEKGSYKQRVFDPLAGARRDENGTLVYNLEDKEIALYVQDSDLRDYYNIHKKFEANGTVDDEEQATLLMEQGVNVLLLEEMNEFEIPTEKWQRFIEEELAVYDEGERYSYVKDMKDAFSEGLKTSLEDKILKTIPDWVFWDIKKPTEEPGQVFMNRFNPGRRVENENFFDARSWDAYLKEKHNQRKVAPTVSHYSNY